jgi:hypothetical protein
MAAVSLSLPRGADGMRASDFTVGTLVPGAGDVEVRITSTLTKKEALVALEACIQALVARNDVIVFPCRRRKK